MTFITAFVSVTSKKIAEKFTYDWNCHPFQLPLYFHFHFHCTCMNFRSFAAAAMLLQLDFDIVSSLCYCQ